MTIDSQYYVRPRAQRTGNQRQPLMYIWHILRLFSIYLLPELGLFIGIPAVEAGIFFGSHKYYSKQACIDDKKLTREICENAEANAAAEFEEKAPHFSSRVACEKSYGGGRCAISFRSSAHVVGAKGAVSFTPRQQGFRVFARSDSFVETTPEAPGLKFSSRTALRRATGINPRAANMAAPRTVAPSPGPVFGVSEPVGPSLGKAALPPPVPNDPNFRCEDYIDPSTKGDSSTACAPAPTHR